MSEDGRTARARAQREERRQEILTTARDVFAEHGYHRTSISQLVSAAGIARGTFYLYFDSKQAIFSELLEGLLADFRDSVVGVDTSEGAPPLLEQLVGTIQQIFAAATEHRTVARLIFREAMAVDEAFDERVQTFEQRLLGYIQESLENGMRLGLLREHDAEVAATCVYGSIRQLLYRLTQAEEPADPTRLQHAAQQVVQFALLGLVAS